MVINDVGIKEIVNDSKGYVIEKEFQVNDVSQKIDSWLNQAQGYKSFIQKRRSV